MKYEKYLLIKLAEEASEVAQAAIKCSLFGYESKDPREIDGETNFVKLQKELLDMIAVLDELKSIDSLSTPNENTAGDYIFGKRKKLNHYYEVASRSD